MCQVLRKDASTSQTPVTSVKSQRRKPVLGRLKEHSSLSQEAVFFWGICLKGSLQSLQTWLGTQGAFTLGGGAHAEIPSSNERGGPGTAAAASERASR